MPGFCLAGLRVLIPLSSEGPHTYSRIYCPMAERLTKLRFLHIPQSCQGSAVSCYFGRGQKVPNC